MRTELLSLARRAAPLLLVPHAALVAPAQTVSPAPPPPDRLGISGPFCPPAVLDLAGGGCVGVSSVPALGYLLPLGPHLAVDAGGRVGLGTTTPAVHLDVVGTGTNASTIRTLTTNAGGAGGILLERPAGTPVSWSLSYDSGAKRDFLIHDNMAGQTRLRIDGAGIVRSGDLYVGSTTAGLRINSSGDKVTVAYSQDASPGGVAMTFEPGLATVNSNLRVIGDVLLSFTDSITWKQVTGTTQPMIHMFDGGFSNPSRMVIAHSPAFQSWGLRYDDASDAFHFVGAGIPALTVALSGLGGNVGVGVSSPANILTVKQGSTTDPVADAWTTYSSRRWKENVAPLEDALELVKRLRGVRFDWKESGEHDLGLIAEEVGEVLPELVQLEENGIDARAVDYARLTAVLVEAVKEQDALLARQAERLSAQERALAGLSERLARLESAAPR